jgi:hypothetical protein
MLTPEVLILKVDELFPAGIVTGEENVAESFELDSPTLSPPAGAGPVSVTVPVDPDPPETVAGLRETPESTGGSGVSAADAEVVPAFAVIVAEV